MVDDRLARVAVLDDQVAGVMREAHIGQLASGARADLDHFEDVLEMVRRWLIAIAPSSSQSHPLTPRPMQLPVAVNQPLVPVQPFQFHARRGQAVEAYAAVH